MSLGGASSAVGGAAVGAGGIAALAAAAKDAEKAEDEGTISHTDAARMAEAFRAALRTQPEFGDIPDDSPGESTDALAGAAVAGGARPGASPTKEAGGSHGSGEEQNQKGRALAEEELRSEGRSMKSVEGGGKRWGRQGASG
jgi:hypothetical protein